MNDGGSLWGENMRKTILSVLTLAIAVGVGMTTADAAKRKHKAAKKPAEVTMASCKESPIMRDESRMAACMKK